MSSEKNQVKMIDVILPIYKEPIEYINQSIDSILNQTYKNFRLIVVIDNPNNKEAINYVKSLSSNYKIEIIINDKNLGLIESLNKALKFVNSEYIARMDADDISNFDRFEKQIKYIEENNLDFVGSNVIWFNDETELFKTKIPLYNNKIKKSMKYVNCFYHPTFLFKKEILNKVPHYSNFPYTEDCAFVLNIIQNGFKVGNVKEPLLKYRCNNLGISRSHSAEQRINGNFIRKLYKKGLYLDENKFIEYYQSKKYKKKLTRVNKYLSLKNSLLYNNLFKKIIKSFLCLFICPDQFIKDCYIKFFIFRKND